MTASFMIPLHFQKGEKTWGQAIVSVADRALYCGRCAYKVDSCNDEKLDVHREKKR